MSTDKKGVQTYVLKCKSCGGPLNMVKGSNLLVCPYCGSKEIIEESDAVKIEKIRSDAYKSVELGRQRMQREERKTGSRRTARHTAAVVFAAVLFVFALTGLAAASSIGSAGSIVISVIQIVLLVLAIVSMSKKGWTFGKHIPGLMILTAAILIIPYLAMYSDSSRGYTRYGEEIPEWNDLILSSRLPDPGTQLSRIYSNSSERLSFEIKPFTQSQFTSYVKACKEAGYSYEQIINSDSGFEAYNEEGYHVDLIYFGSSREMSAYLDVPVQMSEFLWPSHGLARLVPAPQSDIGRIDSDSAQYFTASIGETDKQTFTAYAGTCIDSGFDVDYYLSDTYFSGKNADGVRLTVEYVGFRMMEIRISDYK